jgi:hypothetical protein
MEQQIARQDGRSKRGQHNAGRGRLWGMPFQKGVDGRVAHRERVEQTCREIAMEIGGEFDKLSTYRKTLVKQAAQLICGPQGGGQLVMARRANTLARLFRLLGLEPKKAASGTRLPPPMRSSP